MAGIDYLGTAGEAIYHAEGRVLKVGSAWKYEYVLWDHLGNTRVVFRDDNADGTPEVQSTTSYYPFGLKNEGLSTQSGVDYRYRYNGKELVGDLGLGWHDYGARWYDAAIGRWNAVDPLADQRSWVSPYNYVQNNPILRIDPTGAIDTVNVNKLGVVTGVVDVPLPQATYLNPRPQRVPNVFIDDESEEELFLNDPDKADKEFANKEFKKGDRLFLNLVPSRILRFLIDAGMEGASMGRIERYSWAHEQSLHGKADFPAALWESGEFELSARGSNGETDFRGPYLLRAANTNGLYNGSDAGQFIWGAWMRMNRFTKIQAIIGSNINEAPWGDSGADQRAIRAGYDWVNN